MSDRDPTIQQRKRRHRERLKTGDMYVTGDVPAVDVERAIEAGELDDEESQNPALVFAALMRLARRSLQREKI